MSDLSTEKYLNSINKYQIKHHNHDRTILTYNKNKLGIKLRQKHEIILTKMDSFPTNQLSFAYKKGVCTKDAILTHIGSDLFIKLDINNYFNSIKLDSFINLYGQILDDCNIKRDELESCFYNGELPLGFITSPAISDLYLYKFDCLIEKYLSFHENLRYSRYCDDILISTQNGDFSSLHTFESYIERNIKSLNLELNEKKRREFDLDRDNSVSFLGLNMSKKNDKYRITLSKSFILKTLDVLEYAYKIKQEKENNYSLVKKLTKEGNNISNDEFDKALNSYYENRDKINYLQGVIKSRVAYIKYNSITSYKRFLTKHENKFGFKWGTIWLR